VRWSESPVPPVVLDVAIDADDPDGDHRGRREAGKARLGQPRGRCRSSRPDRPARDNSEAPGDMRVFYAR
jgi:hypothetical protein